MTPAMAYRICMNACRAFFCQKIMMTTKTGMTTKQARASWKFQTNISTMITTRLSISAKPTTKIIKNS